MNIIKNPESEPAEGLAIKRTFPSPRMVEGRGGGGLYQPCSDFNPSFERPCGSANLVL